MKYSMKFSEPWPRTGKVQRLPGNSTVQNLFQERKDHNISVQTPDTCNEESQA
jgi:hypothetical protein